MINSHQMALPCSCGYARLGHSKTAEEPVTLDEDTDIGKLLAYLLKTKDKAEMIRENSPAGSYLDSVLQRTIAGIDTEIATLRYLSPADAGDIKSKPARMRPAL